MADGKTSFDIDLKTRGDTSGAEKVTAAVEEVKTATQEAVAATQKHDEAVKEDVATQQEEVDAFTAARESLRAKLEALKEDTGATEKHTQATRDMDGAAGRAPVNLRGLAVGLGGAAAAIGIFQTAANAWLEQHPEVQGSLEDLKHAATELGSNALSQWFDRFILSASGAQTLLDSLTIALGGATEEMRAAAAPLENFASYSDDAAGSAEALAKQLDAEARAASASAAALEANVEALKRKNAETQAAEDLALSRQKRGIDADLMLDDPAKARLKAKADNDADERRRQRAAEERDAETAAAAAKAAQARDQANAAGVVLKGAAKQQAKEVDLRAAMEAQILALKQQLDEALIRSQAETDPNDPGAKRVLAEIAQLRAMIADLERGKQSLATGDPGELQKRIELLTARARELEQKALAAEQAARSTAGRNSSASAIDATQTQQRAEERDAAAEALAKKSEEERIKAELKAREEENRRQRAEEAKQRREAERAAEQQRKEAERLATQQTGTAGRAGDRAAAGMRGAGFDQAAQQIEAAMAPLADGATAQEVATATQAIVRIAQQMQAANKGDAALRAQLRALNTSLKTLEGTVAAMKGREESR